MWEKSASYTWPWSKWIDTQRKTPWDVFIKLIKKPYFLLIFAVRPSLSADYQVMVSLSGLNVLHEILWYHVPALARYARWKFVIGLCLSHSSRDYVPVNLIQDAPKAVFGFLSRLLKSWTFLDVSGAIRELACVAVFRPKRFTTAT